MVNSGGQLPMASIDSPVTGPSPELLATLVLQRASGGEVAKLGVDYLERGLPASGDLAVAFDAVADAGLLALADPDAQGLRRITRTTAGQARYTQLLAARETSCAGVRVPDPQFTHKIPAGRRSSSCPAPLRAPGGQPDPTPEAAVLPHAPVLTARLVTGGVQ